MKRYMLIALMTLIPSVILAVEPEVQISTRRVKNEFVTKTIINPQGQQVTVTQTVPVIQDQYKKLKPFECAVIVCDMWDNHWCKAAATRCDALAKKTEPVMAAMRASGATIIHCPSDTMEFYKDHDARKRTLALPKVQAPKPKDIPSPPLPIDDKNGGCDDAEPVKSFRAWKRQHEAIKIDDKLDFITDKGDDVYNIIADKKIKTVFVLGVHTNMCVLNRTFAIKQLRKWDIDCLLVRDLTDAMYDPRSEPKVTHEEGTNLVINYIETHWCPSVTSDVLAKFPKK